MNDTISMLLLPLQVDFMRNAFIITLAIALPMALLSCYLVLKGWSLMGDAVSHAVLPGVVLAYAAGLPLAVGAFAAGMVCAISAGFIKNNSRVKEDTVLGIVFSGMFGLGVVLIVKVQSGVHLDHILFGDMLGITAPDMVEALAIAVAATAFLLILRKDLMVHAFDPHHARAIGLKVGLLHYGLLVVLSLVVVGALTSVGIILAIALLVAPGSIAFLVARTFGGMLVTAVTAALFAVFTGIYASFFIDSAPAPTIVLVMSGLFILAFIRNRIVAHRQAKAIVAA
ncbi:metal ABC transporter permease [Allorhizobium borbori]|uniref:Manganese/iron transport system permease protein n=1 Tax=Allorhizobium borbori TaxID=485907 RepID=A0A7W6JYZ1_9HYPH|nr:metal ABC transporter permease [Allorhizobium borbori]MBB4102153.1 manganese/iron transport system permease protein [Allorhizobium borbori]